MKIEEVINAVVKISNESDSERQYDISANVGVVINKRSTGGQISNGIVSILDGQQIATFAKYQFLTVNWSTEDEEIISTVQELIFTFCNEAKKFAEKTVITASIPE